MRNRAPVPRDERPPLPEFEPVPRRFRHDGWTPERQKAFIEALADTGCVSRAATMVNMAQTNCYSLRRAPGAEGFRRAWDAALDFGLKRLKDIAFERAIEGTLVPVFVAGKLMGFRRKYNDGLLMFCLRHYGTDSNGKRTTINYFSTRASAGAAAGGGGAEGAGAGAGAEAATTTVRTVIAGPAGGSKGESGAEGDDQATALIQGFEGVALDPEAAAAIAAALEACAARAREMEAACARGGDIAADAIASDPGESFVRVLPTGNPYRGELVPPVELVDFTPMAPGEAHWSQAGVEMPPELARFEAEREAAALLGGPGGNAAPAPDCDSIATTPE